MTRNLFSIESPGAHTMVPPTISLQNKATVHRPQKGKRAQYTVRKERMHSDSIRQSDQVCRNSVFLSAAQCEYCQLLADFEGGKVNSGAAPSWPLQVASCALLVTSN